jgi:hypothetical protein
MTELIVLSVFVLYIVVVVVAMIHLGSLLEKWVGYAVAIIIVSPLLVFLLGLPLVVGHSIAS